MNDLEKVKEMYFEEGIQLPDNFEERFRHLIVLDHPSTRELFLVMARNDLLCGTIKDKDLFHKFDYELQQIWKKKNGKTNSYNSTN